MFVIEGTVIWPDLHPGMFAWFDEAERDGGPAVTGSEFVVEHVLAMETLHLETPMTPTGPVVLADMNDGRWALLAALEMFGPNPVLKGNVPVLDAGPTTEGVVY